MPIGLDLEEATGKVELSPGAGQEDSRFLFPGNDIHNIIAKSYGYAVNPISRMGRE
jgi:hypothetical protein